MWLVVVQGSEALDYSNSAAFIAVVLFALSCQLFCSPMGCSPPGSSVHGSLQARMLEWVAISSSRGSSRPRNGTHVSYVSCIGRRVLYHCATWDDTCDNMPY